MPYWSIRFRGIEGSPRGNKGGIEFKKWMLLEYSQVGVPDNIEAAVIKDMEKGKLEEIIEKRIDFLIQEKETKADPDNGGTWKYCVCKACGYSEEHKAGHPCGKCPECGEQMQGSNEKTKMDDEGTIPDIDKLTDGQKHFLSNIFKHLQKLKSLTERVDQQIPWEALRIIWFAFLDELWTCDGKEKTVRAILKEMLNIITPYAMAFAAESEGNEGMAIDEVKTLLESKTYTINKKEKEIDPKPKQKKKDVILKLRESLPEPKKPKLPITKSEIQEIVKGAVAEEIKTSLNYLRGKIS